MSSINNLGQYSKLQRDSLSRLPLNLPVEKLRYARVLRVVMDSDDPDWDMLGCSQALYGVFYQELFKGQEERARLGLNFAYCKQDGLKRVPIENEIVSLTSEVDAEESDRVGFLVEKTYWNSVIPVWNSPHLNAFPDTLESPGPADTGEFFKEESGIYPLQLCPGDTVLEGRHGQSIRMGGTDCDSDYSPIATEDNNGSPYLIIRNGQADVANLKEKYAFKDGSGSMYSVNENIDYDKSSIYLTSNHQVPLTQASKKRKAWKDGKGPVLAKDYQGAQIVANADRIYINSKKDDIELSSKDAIGINAEKNISVDGGDYVSFDADKILLGEAAVLRMGKSDAEPVLKGKTTTEWLYNVCNQLKVLLEALGKNGEGDSKTWISTVISAASGVKASLDSFQSMLSNLHSSKVFTE